MIQSDVCDLYFINTNDSGTKEPTGSILAKWQRCVASYYYTRRALRERKGRRPAPNCGHILSLIPALGRRMRLYHSSSRRGYCGSLPGCVIPSTSYHLQPLPRPPPPPRPIEILSMLAGGTALSPPTYTRSVESNFKRFDRDPYTPWRKTYLLHRKVNTRWLKWDEFSARRYTWNV